jgi:predicted dithiol-disulfide oxidoreductase (DUF899 family)
MLNVEKGTLQEGEPVNTPPIVSAQEWEAAHQEMLVKEKELTRARDALAAMRRQMPWTPVATQYEFEGPDGRVSLLDLFDGRRQLVVYRAFVEPACTVAEHGCVGCSLMADHIGNLAHLNAATPRSSTPPVGRRQTSGG